MNRDTAASLKTPAWVREGRARPRAILLGAETDERVCQQLDALRPVLAKHLDILWEDFSLQRSFQGVEADLVIVLGGDGAILRAARQMQMDQLPVLGVNLGRLGFLAAISPADLDDALQLLINGECEIVEHLMFQCTVERDGQPRLTQLGLNEVAVLGGPPFSLLDVDLYVDSEWATTYSCDGLIISTPVGSTAHNLSAGGPILRQDMQAFVIVPISPHTLTVRPVVDTAQRTYEMAVHEPREGTSVVVDGVVLGSLTAADRIRVQRAEPCFKTIKVAGHDDYATLREKLGWGGIIRGRKS
ncbi:MAG: NAD(+)/NADH kinase [Planctomycetota bacterium]|nr:NAD(+)/NADH kinase [Planctomycetota bacterium]